MIKIGLLGASGKMGGHVSSLLKSDFQKIASLSVEASSKSPLGGLLATQAVIDFSRPQAISKFAEVALKHAQTSKKQLPTFVIGSTGFTPKEYSKIEALSKKTRVLCSSNFSLGVGFLHKLLKENSAVLKKMGFTPVLTETHHRHKKDAPSGTAIWLSEAITQGSGLTPHAQSIRAGDIVGDHEVQWFGNQEVISLSHRALDRSIFARGAIDVAVFMVSNPKLFAPGRIHTMEEYFSCLK